MNDNMAIIIGTLTIIGGFTIVSIAVMAITDALTDWYHRGE